MDKPLLEIRNLQIEGHYEDAWHPLIKGIDLTIHAGEMLAIIGASGSGKSTLMNILGGLDYATAGSYKINGLHMVKAAPGPEI